ncbi:glycine cleavage system protein R [Pseudomonas fluvialis]|uniref:Glycine cleavage system transcriptional repressor n=1 Tax=Pseudomonas fluvialis TaxID=1793966 RepID=A0A2I0CLC3_9PSED|nr:ACT domain-containing protein [Pseudomonas pharmacofabricae]PKF69966.1 glycine cleavage system protein R [Pseudomonas pharmacofabricae]
MEHLVLTVIAADQPGLVEKLASCIAEQGGNWLESRMARMAGQFAGILSVAVPATQQAALVEALQALAGAGIRVQLASSGVAPEQAVRHISLDLLGNDRPGIVRDITRLLSSHAINVEDLQTEVLPAPMSSDLLFHAVARLAVPQGLTLEQLQAQLETLADELMVELNLQAD